MLKSKRAKLQTQLSAIDAKLARLEKPAKAAKAAKAPAKASARGGAKKSPAASAKTAVKSKKVVAEEITSALTKAGAKGISIPQIAKNLSLKPEVVKAWFSAKSKSTKGLKQIANGRYGIVAAAPKAAAKSAPKAPAKAAKKAPAAKAPKASKAPRAQASKAKAPKTVKPPKASDNPSKRGELKSDIISILKAAGSEGATITDLSEKLNKPYKNLYIWFVTTGKRIPGIKKVAPARYALIA